MDTPGRGDDEQRDPESRREPGWSANSGRLVIVLSCLTEVIQFVSAILDLVS
ncbi:hypothetical protein ACFFQW_05845 [Umezawaea endophytica]|uniref:Uncharacterized protein n=1 Tax=Umezawaea endophytica TaxID=1654476 RepID=A0A9X2VR28_9PSEU|nr:hypothetical protein [Umezawaea endophytica]MCS7481151.1 hypothetical protein [Umezawaea endophytica]